MDIYCSHIWEGEIIVTFPHHNTSWHLIRHWTISWKEWLLLPPRPVYKPTTYDVICLHWRSANSDYQCEQKRKSVAILDIVVTI